MQRGKALETLKELRKLKSESDAMAVEPGLAIQGRFSSFPANWYLWLYKRYLCGARTVDDSVTQLELQYEELSREVEVLSNQEHQSTGNAVIVFNWVSDAANMLYDHNLRNTPANLFVPSFIGRSFNIVTKGRFAKTHRMLLTPSVGDGQKTFTHRHVTVTRAPEPSDFMWENTQYGGWPIIRRRIIAWVSFLPFSNVLCCSCTVGCNSVQHMDTNCMCVLQGLYVALLVASFTVQLVLTSLEQDGVKDALENKVCEVWHCENTL